MFEDRPIRDGYVALAAIVLVAVVAYLLAPRKTATIERFEATPDTAAMERAAGPVVRVNADGPRRLRKMGFSYYHISQILYLRSVGYAFRADSNLLSLRHADTALIESLAGRLDFSAPDSMRDVGELASIFRRGGYYPRNEWRERDSVRGGRAYYPRIPFFAADSAQMAEAGMSPDAWDTLAAYQRGFVVRGSMRLDSLVALPAGELSVVLRRNASPRRAPGREDEEAEGERVVVDINTAGRDELMRVRGIGAKTADAILDLRRRLGGFVSVAQVKEVWSVTPERYEAMASSLTVSTGRVTPVNVNSANDSRLRRHPYFPSLLANRIAQVRLRKNGARLTRADIEHCAEGVELSEFFWDYVAY